MNHTQEKINLFLMDMSNSQHTSGVDRYMETLIDGLQTKENVVIHWIHLVHNKQLFFSKEEHTHYGCKLTIPLPQQPYSIITQKFWNKKYNSQIYKLICHLFRSKENCIIHLHTLNLIDLAMFCKAQTDCKVITHLHCIPWKSWYDSNRKRFDQLYIKTYIQSQQLSCENYLTNNCELDAYLQPDALICVTHSAVSFLKKCIGKYTAYTTVVPNGIKDFAQEPVQHFFKSKTETFHCLFVGGMNESKGVNFILKAIENVRSQGYSVKLTLAGTCPNGFHKKIEQNYPDMDIEVLGRVPFNRLQLLYRHCDIGIIGSLQEQASYVAIEMSMFGLPIITTAVDGLDEMFTDEENALKVNTLFSPVFGLSVDTDMMSIQIIRLIEDSDLRVRLSRNVRLRYEKEWHITSMIEKTIDVYNRVLKSNK